MDPWGGVSGIAAAANEGMFAVDQATGQQMTMSIGRMRTELTRQLSRIDHLKTRAKLGELPEARAIADLDAHVASGDRQSIDFVLQRFAEALEQAHEGVRVGMANYAEVEAQNEQLDRVYEV